MSKTTNCTNVDKLNAAYLGKPPGHLGLEPISMEDGRVIGRFEVRSAPSRPYGLSPRRRDQRMSATSVALTPSQPSPEGASGFTTVEIKCNFAETLREGVFGFTAKFLHGGRSTQVWMRRSRTLTAAISWPPSAAPR
jgi:1,4-dihydroxy-2-naphthoyl-CoA hydrolase